MHMTKGFQHQGFPNAICLIKKSTSYIVDFYCKDNTEEETARLHFLSPMFFKQHLFAHRRQNKTQASSLPLN